VDLDAVPLGPALGLDPRFRGRTAHGRGAGRAGPAVARSVRSGDCVRSQVVDGWTMGADPRRPGRRRGGGGRPRRCGGVRPGRRRRSRRRSRAGSRPAARARPDGDGRGRSGYWYHRHAPGSAVTTGPATSGRRSGGAGASWAAGSQRRTARSPPACWKTSGGGPAPRWRPRRRASPKWLGTARFRSRFPTLRWSGSWWGVAMRVRSGQSDPRVRTCSAPPATATVTARAERSDVVPAPCRSLRPAGVGRAHRRAEGGGDTGSVAFDRRGFGEDGVRAGAPLLG
jgi:hypothetical protein